jgi:hypothetical protein
MSCFVCHMRAFILGTCAHSPTPWPVCLQVSFEPESLPSVRVSGDSPAAWKGELLAVAVTQDDLHTTCECECGGEGWLCVDGRVGWDLLGKWTCATQCVLICDCILCVGVGGCVGIEWGLAGPRFQAGLVAW